jgi:hypothetical protein
MNRESWSRGIAIFCLAIPVGWWFARDEAAKLSRYRSMSHEALMSALEAQSIGVVPMIIGAVMMLAIGYFGVEALSGVIKRLVRWTDS